MRLSEGFYDELWTEIAGGGIEAFYHYLLHLDLSGFNPKSGSPGTVAKRDLAEVSKQSEDQFIKEWMGQAIPRTPSGRVAASSSILPTPDGAGPMVCAFPATPPSS